MATQYQSQLVLEDGSVFKGYGFGGRQAVSGEVVFNTAMTGYTESLTDPSYFGQILTLTYPIIGNYGIPPQDTADGLPLFFESGKAQVSGLIVHDYAFQYSHWNAAQSLDEWLRSYGVPAIYGIDTRSLTQHIREFGVMRGVIVPEGERQPAFGTAAANAVAAVSCAEPSNYGSGKRRIVLVDCGSKHNIIRCLTARDASVTCVPWNFDFSAIEYDGIMISNGPGNPQDCAETIANIRRAMVKGKPIFGICLGHQLLAIAAGASTYKLKFGHRSHNQPVQRIGGNRAFITSQNHGYAVDAASLPPDWQQSFVNLNDSTNEGIRHASLPFFSVQFHPEASSGPADTEFLFDDFLAAVEERR